MRLRKARLPWYVAPFVPKIRLLYDKLPIFISAVGSFMPLKEIESKLRGATYLIYSTILLTGYFLTPCLTLHCARFPLERVRRLSNNQSFSMAELLGRGLKVRLGLASYDRAVSHKWCKAQISPEHSWRFTQRPYTPNKAVRLRFGLPPQLVATFGIEQRVCFIYHTSHLA